MDDAYGDGSELGEGPRFVGYVLGGEPAPCTTPGDTIVTDALREALDPLGIDVALLPINGRDAERESRGIVGNMDAAEAVELAVAIGASTLVPYHWDGFAGNTVPPGRHGRRWPPGASTSSSRAASGRSSFPDAAAAQRRVASSPREAANVGGRVGDQRPRGDLGRILVAGDDPVEDRPVEGERPAPRPARRRGEQERRAQHGPQDPAEVLEELVVARGEDPRVELEVRGEVRGLVIDAGLHRGERLGDRDDLLVRRARRGEPGRERLDRQPNLGRLLVELLVVRRLGCAS